MFHNRIFSIYYQYPFTLYFLLRVNYFKSGYYQISRQSIMIEALPINVLLSSWLHNSPNNINSTNSTKHSPESSFINRKNIKPTILRQSPIQRYITRKKEKIYVRELTEHCLCELRTESPVVYVFSDQKAYRRTRGKLLSFINIYFMK